MSTTDAGCPGRWDLGRILVFAVSVVATACGPVDQARTHHVVQHDSAGVTVVRSEGLDRELEWEVIEVVSIGGAEEGPNSFFRVPEHSIELASNGDILILDSGNGRVLRFDSTGVPLGPVATAGEGPGELRRPQSLALDPADRVLVLDMPRLGVVTFTLEGQLVDEIPLGIPYGEIDFFRGGLLHAGAGTFKSDRDSLHPSLAWRGPDGTVDLVRTAKPRPPMIDYGCIGLAQSPLFEPELTWGTNGDVAAVSEGVGYDILVFEGHAPRARYRRDVQPRPVTREIAVAELGAGTVMRSPAGECVIDPDSEVEARGFQLVLPAIDDVAVDPEGRLWVRRSAFRGERPRIDILEPDGRYLGTIKGIEMFPSAFLTPELFLARTTDQLDVEYVKLFRLKLEAPGQR